MVRSVWFDAPRIARFGSVDARQGGCLNIGAGCFDRPADLSDTAERQFKSRELYSAERLPARLIITVSSNTSSSGD
jgi:hypothetical protein